MWTLQSELICTRQNTHEAARERGEKNRERGGLKITTHKNSLSEEVITSYYGAYHWDMGVAENVTAKLRKAQKVN